MAERVVLIKLLADATGMTRGMAAARDSVGELRDEVKSSAVSQRQAWATVGASLSAVGVAMTGVTALVLKTGIAYNTLQQTSRAALTTLLGSAQAANQQMDRLDAFARTSPFAKQVFIQAQQQMLAFGIETKKVIPYLDSVQNAVAAMGGSNQQISDIVTIMSKIQSSAKITATDLMQFGNHGVDAAALIGSQVGKTAGQIRADISAGALDAGRALDALAAGMQERFGGAAANVKNTFDGAMDRVKAAWRDFASELAKPLVDPNGGGALVDLLNWTADVMRGFQKLPDPIKNVTGALFGLTGVAALFAGGAILALPKWFEFQAALSAVGGVAGVAQKGLLGITTVLQSPLLYGLIAATAAVWAFNQAIERGKTPQSEFQRALQQTTNLTDALRIATQDTKSNYWTVGFRESLEDLPGLLDRAIESNKSFMSVVGMADSKALENLKQLGDELAAIAATDFGSAQTAFARLRAEQELTEEQVLELLNRMPALKSAFADAAVEIGRTADDSTILALAYGEVDYNGEKVKQSLEGIQGVAADTSAAISDLADEILNFGRANIDAERAAIKFEEQLAELNARVAEGAAGFDISTDAGQANRSSLLDLAEATARSSAATWEATGSQEAATATLERGREALIRAAVQYGMTEEEARSYADQLLATPETVDTKVNLRGVSEAEAALGNLARDRIASITVRANMPDLNGAASGGGRPGIAQGGTVGYAQGGTILSAAPGRTILGVGGGVASGTVFGQGTSKSDSVLVRLSRGEEVIQEPHASQSRDLLKAINRGDFHQGMVQPQVIVQPSAAPSLDGLSISGRLEIGGDGIARLVDGRIDRAFAGVSSERLQSAGLGF